MPLEGLRQSLAALIGGMRVGEQLGGWELVHIDVDESMAYAFERAGERLEISLSERDAGVPHFAQSAYFNVSYSVSRLPGKELSDDARELVAAVAARIAERDQGRAARRLATVQPASSKGEIREIRVEHLLCPTSIEGDSYYTANPYVGCLIGCSFCYAQPRVKVIRRMAGFPDLDWGRFVTVKINAAELLAQELERRPLRPVVFSPLVSDVYQPIERKLGVTRACLEVLAERKVQSYLLTRSALVERDVDVFQAIPDATVGFSVPTDIDAVAKAYEPRAALISQRFAILRKLRAAGVRTVAVIQPLLHMDVENLVARLAEACDLIRVDVYRPPALGGAPLVSHNAAIPEPPADQAALRERIIEAAERRGLSLWTRHVPM